MEGNARLYLGSSNRLRSRVVIDASAFGGVHKSLRYGVIRTALAVRGILGCVQSSLYFLIMGCSDVDVFMMRYFGDVVVKPTSVFQWTASPPTTVGVAAIHECLCPDAYQKPQAPMWICYGCVRTWLILPAVICLSQRLSHACLSVSFNMARL